ncbi:GspH/FimT family pseudopilin [Microbulbifer epialgicus]|uniref:Type II secretion system protein H n=1 Tax=Microbulbifer epialgicus TaxID=393907 RepID=A0ABV4NWU7_9GAMM
MKRFAGFTLIELLITITILAIVVAIALPPFTSFIKHYKNKSKQFELFEILVLMRNKAYYENISYTLCARGQDEKCADNWTNGALLFADHNKNGSLDSGETITRKFTLENKASLSWNYFGSKNYVIFNPNGETPSQSGNFRYCPATNEAEYGWIIILNIIGRPYFGKDSDGDGIVETGSQLNLTCPQT